MINYIEFLLKDYNNTYIKTEHIRKILLPDDDAYKLLINAILETDLKPYIGSIIDYPLVPYTSLNTNLDLVELDKQLKHYYNSIKNSDLYYIFVNHFNPIWRVAAFVCDFVLQLHNYYIK